MSTRAVRHCCTDSRYKVTPLPLKRSVVVRSLVTCECKHFTLYRYHGSIGANYRLYEQVKLSTYLVLDHRGHPMIYIPDVGDSRVLDTKHDMIPGGRDPTLFKDLVPSLCYYRPNAVIQTWYRCYTWYSFLCSEIFEPFFSRKEECTV